MKTRFILFSTIFFLVSCTEKQTTSVDIMPKDSVNSIVKLKGGKNTSRLKIIVDAKIKCDDYIEISHAPYELFQRINVSPGEYRNEFAFEWYENEIMIKHSPKKECDGNINLKFVL